MAERDERIERESSVDYAQWRDSYEWIEIIRPAIEREESVLRQRLVSADPKDAAEIAEYQGAIRALVKLRQAPEWHFEKLRREMEAQEEEQQKNERPVSDGPLRRLLSYGGRRTR